MKLREDSSRLLNLPKPKTSDFNFRELGVDYKVESISLQTLTVCIFFITVILIGVKLYLIVDLFAFL